MIAEQEQQTEARIDHETALALAAQAVVDFAIRVEELYLEHNDLAYCALGRMQDLTSSIESWRALGGTTTEEQAEGMEDHYFSKGTTLQ